MAETKRAAAYIPWNSLLTATEVLEQGLPKRLDRSVFPSFSGSMKSWVLSAFAFLDFTDENGNVTPRLEEWVKSQEAGRKEIMRAIVESKYKALLDLADEPGTPDQFKKEMEKLGVSGGTTQRAVRFFLAAAKFAGIDIPESWKKKKKSKVSVSGSGSRRRRHRNDAGASDPDGDGDGDGGAPDAAGDTITLECGSTVTLTVALNPLTLSEADRMWLFGLIDEFKSHASASEDGFEDDEGDFDDEA